MPSIARKMSLLDAAGTGGVGVVTHVQQEFVTVNGQEVVVVGDQGTTHEGNGGPSTGGGYAGPGDFIPNSPATPGVEDEDDDETRAPDVHLEYQWRVSEGKSYITINGLEVAFVGSMCDCNHKIIDGEDFVQIL